MANHVFAIEAQGIRCSLNALGASIMSVRVKDAWGRDTEVALSPRNFLSGEPDPSLTGRTLAPCCGRVRGGQIEVDGLPVMLTRNEGANHIHGGIHGAAHQVWEGRQLSSAHVQFVLQLPDGLDGYPGNRTLTADYHAEENTLKVIYTARTDRTTWIDMTNHVYWDLSGRFDGSAMHQAIEIAADRVVHNDQNHLPVQIVPAEAAFDFSVPASPAEKIAAYPQEEQLAIGRGYNNAFVLNAARDYAVRLTSGVSGIRMTMQTDQPAVVFYSGGFLGEQTVLQNGGATPGCALAFEAQGIPDPFHLPGQQAEHLHPGQQFKREISWRFDRA